MPQRSIKTNEMLKLLPVKNYFLVEVIDQHNSFFWAVMLALLTQPEIYSSVPLHLFNRDQVFRDRAFQDVCKKCFAHLSIAEEQKIKKIIEQFKVSGDLTFIVRNKIFKQAITFMRQKSEDYFKNQTTVFAHLAPQHGKQFLNSLSIPGRFPNQIDIKALAMALDCELVITDSATQRLECYPVSACSLTTQQPSLDRKKPAIYLEVAPKKSYAFGRVDSSLISHLKKLLIRFSWKSRQKIKKKISSQLNKVKSEMDVQSKRVKDSFSELDSRYTSMMTGFVFGLIVLPSSPALRVFFSDEKELAALSFKNAQTQSPQEYNGCYQTWLTNLANFDLYWEWFISPQTPFRKAFITGALGDVFTHARTKQRMGPLLLFGLFLTFFIYHPEVTEDSVFIFIEMMLQMSCLMFLGGPHLLHGLETTYSLFQKTNQIVTPLACYLTGKIKQATYGCFFNPVDEPECEEIFLGESQRPLIGLFNHAKEPKNEEIFLGETILGRLFNQVNDTGNDAVFLEDPRITSTLR